MYRKTMIIGLWATLALFIGIQGNEWVINHPNPIKEHKLTDWDKLKQQQDIIKQVEKEDRELLK